MNSTIARSAAVATLALIALVGCAGPQTAGPDTEPEETGETPQSESVTLSTADSPLGTIVVDGEGLTLYVFDQDTPGSGFSACEGECLDNWPPLTSSEEPEVDGVTSEVGLLEDGSEHVTLGGLPLYYYVGDQEPGDVTGQAVGGVWWVVGPDGEKITENIDGLDY